MPRFYGVKLTTVWIVRDPGPLSELADVVGPCKVREFAALAIGTGHERWRQENTTLYTEEGEAVADASERIARRRQKPS